MPWSEEMFADSEQTLDITYEQVRIFLNQVVNLAQKFSYGRSRMTKGRLQWHQRSRSPIDYKTKANNRELNLNHQHWS